MTTNAQLVMRKSTVQFASMIILAISAGVALPGSVFALGFRIPNQDAEAIARANAFVATADNPSAIYYNPAGITQIEGTQVRVGAHVISVNSHFESSSSSYDEDTEFEIQMVPQMYAVYSPEDSDFSYGLGVYVPFGLGLEWPESSQLRNFAVEGRLLYTTVNPVAAWQITDTLSLAAGPTINWGQALLRRGIGIVPGDEFRFRGHGFAFGAKAGLRWQPHDQWAFGVTYFSPTSIDFKGNSSVKPLVPGETGTTARIDFPQFVVGGISYRPTPDWNIEVAVDWTDWETLDTITFKDTAFGDSPYPLNWNSSFMCHLGVTRQLKNDYWVSAGYFYSENSTPEDDFTAQVPDTDLHVISVGVGHRGERWGWAVAAQVIMGPERDISNGNAADGTYQFFNQAINFAINYRF